MELVDGVPHTGHRGVIQFLQESEDDGVLGRSGLAGTQVLQEVLDDIVLSLKQGPGLPVAALLSLVTDDAVEGRDPELQTGGGRTFSTEEGVRARRSSMTSKKFWCA